MKLILIGIVILFAEQATAAVLIEIYESQGNVEAVLSGSLNLDATGGPLGGFGTGYNGFSAQNGVVSFTSDEITIYAMDFLSWTPFGGSDVLHSWDSSVGDPWAMYYDSLDVAKLGVPVGYVSGQPFSASAIKTNTTLNDLELYWYGTFETMLTNGDVTDTVTVIVNGPPTVDWNAGLTLQEDGQGVITNNLLSVSDPDTSPDSIAFIVTTGPALGTLRLNGAPILKYPEVSFTQRDIDSGSLSYKHDGSETSNDIFIFDVGDGRTLLLDNFFNITVLPVNDAPYLSINEPLSLVAGESATISESLLKTVDPDTVDSELIYTLVTTPDYGTVARDGDELGQYDTFSQSDIKFSLVSYQHGGGDSSADIFVFEVSDGMYTMPDASFVIQIHSQEIFADGFEESN